MDNKNHSPLKPMTCSFENSISPLEFPEFFSGLYSAWSTVWYTGCGQVTIKVGLKNNMAIPFGW